MYCMKAPLSIMDQQYSGGGYGFRGLDFVKGSWKMLQNQTGFLIDVKKKFELVKKESNI